MPTNEGERPTCVLIVRALPGVEPIEALRHAKSWLPRKSRIEALSIQERPAEPAE